MKLFRILIILMLSNVTFLFSKEFKIIKDIEVNPMHLALIQMDKSEKTDINGDIVGLIIIHSGIEELFIDSSFKYKQQFKNGDYYVFLFPDTKYISFKKKGFVSLKYNLRDTIGGIKSNTVYEMSVDEKDPSSSKISLMIISNQNGAEVFVDGISKGITEKKILSLTIPKGDHVIKVQKEGFMTQEINKTFTKKDKSLEINLALKMPAPVEINSIPEQAMIYIDSLKFGITPKNDFLDIGNHSIHIEKENYETIDEIITVDKNGISKTYRLKDIRASLTVETYPNAIVEFNDEVFEGSVIDYKLTPQILNIMVKMPNVTPLNRVIHLKKNMTKTVKMFPDIPKGSFQIVVIPADAKIEFKMNSTECFVPDSLNSFTNIPIGKYELIVSAENYETHNETIEINENLITSKQIILNEGSNIADKMIFVKGGSFLMGSDTGFDTHPIHEVEIDDFYIGKHEVTIAEFITFLNDIKLNSTGIKNGKLLLDLNNSSCPIKYTSKKFYFQKNKYADSDKCPIFEVTWFGADAYCKWSGGRLPTEAEWEFAARGGSESQNNTSLLYSGSNNIAEVAWFSQNSKGKCHIVGEKKPNILGLFDMTGNVYEWCSDNYAQDYYSKSTTRNPKGPEYGKCSILRGGSWNITKDFSTVDFRFNYDRNVANTYFGFRLLMPSLKSN